MGPSAIELVLWEDHLKERFAVGVIHTHPFHPSIYVHGVFKKSLVNSTTELNRAIANLIVHSHNQDIVPILSSLPTSIMIFDDTPIDTKVIKHIFKRAAEDLESYNINDDCELLEEYAGDPWGRTAVQRDRAIESAVTGINPFDVARPADWDSIFDRWWYLVTEQEHVMSEVTECPNAYKGAIDFRNGRFAN